MGLLKEAVDLFRETLRANRKEWLAAKPIEALTVEELQARVYQGHQVLDMMKSQGWAVYADRARKQIDAGQAELTELPPFVFKSARGLQAKGEIIGGKTVLNIVARIVAEGTDAEAKLEKLSEKGAEAERKARDMRRARAV